MAKSTTASKAKSSASSTKSPAKKSSKASPKAKPAARKTKTASAAKKASTTKKQSAGDEEVTIDRRTQGERRNEETADTPPAGELKPRKKVNRRRQIDPTTCERDYSDQEVEFMNAMDEYKRTSGRMFPTCSEVLEVIRGLGYVQLSPAELAARQPAEQDGDQDDPNSESAFDGDGSEEAGELEELEEAFA